jgi:hypothetical protein
VPVIEGDTLPASTRLPGDVSRLFVAGPALRGPSDRPIEITTPAQVSTHVGDPYGGSHVARSIIGFFAEGGTSVIFQRAVDATAVNATATVPGASGTVLTATADGPGTWGNNLQIKVEAGSGTRKKITVLEGTATRVVAEADSSVEAAQRLTTAGVALFTVGAGTWPPPNTTSNIALTGGAAADSAVTDTNVVTAIGKFVDALGPGTVAAPGYTSQVVHEALMDHCRARGRVAALDYADTTDVGVLTARAAANRAYAAEKGARVTIPIAPWEVVSIGSYLTVPVPPSALQAGRQALADREDPQKQARVAAGPEYASRFSQSVTRVYSDADRQTLYNAGINLLEAGPEGVYLNGSRTGVDSERWPQYTFIAGARTRMAIVDRARQAVRPFLFKALDGQGIRLETIKGVVENECKPFAEEPISGLFDVNGDGGYSVSIASSLQELSQGRVRVQLGLRTSPTTELIVIEFSAIALTDRF